MSITVRLRLPSSSGAGLSLTGIMLPPSVECPWLLLIDSSLPVTSVRFPHSGPTSRTNRLNDAGGVQTGAYSRVPMKSIVGSGSGPWMRMHYE